jgi:hypothetical protein
MLAAKKVRRTGTMDPELEGALSAIQVLIWHLVFHKILPAENVVADLERGSGFRGEQTQACLRRFALLARAAGDLPWPKLELSGLKINGSGGALC